MPQLPVPQLHVRPVSNNDPEPTAHQLPAPQTPQLLQPTHPVAYATHGSVWNIDNMATMEEANGVIPHQVWYIVNST